jgi:hypothetical protein
MNEQIHFLPGQTALLRQMWQGRIWEARPEIVIRDTPELLAFYMPPQTILKKTDAKGLGPTGAARKGWGLNDTEWHFGGKLRLSIPGHNYSVILLRNLDGTPYEWYINLEKPLERTLLGFDYEDLILDISLSPDISDWRWKDEDELEEAVAAGLISKEQSTTLYTEGKSVAESLQSGKSIFNGWADWQPDPSWQVPVLPEGWDVI